MRKSSCALRQARYAAYAPSASGVASRREQRPAEAWRASYRHRQGRIGEEAIGLHGFSMNFLKGRDTVVPLQQCSGMTPAANGAFIGVSNGISYPNVQK